MNLSQTSNPVLGRNTFERAFVSAEEDRMTVRGTMNKTALVILFVFAAAFYTWQKFFNAYDPAAPAAALSSIKLYLLIGGIGGFITAIIATFAQQRAGFLTPIYAIFEGMFLGGLSAMFEAQFPGLVIRAVALTFAVFLAMLFIYRQQIIKVT